MKRIKLLMVILILLSLQACYDIKYDIECTFYGNSNNKQCDKGK